MAAKPPMEIGSRPVPDPTELTTDIVNSAKGDLRSEIRHAVEAIRELFEEKFKSVESKFAGVQTQMQERDTRVETSGRDNKLAIDAALQAAEKAVNKSESGFTKQIDEMGRTISAKIDGINVTMTDLKDRIGMIEGRSTGVGMSVGTLINAVIAVAAVGALVVTLFLHR